MTSKQEIAVAACLHEAGHAVVGRVLGLVCGEVTLATPDGLGHAHVEPRWRWREREYGAPKQLAEAFAVALYAGAESERVILGISEPDGDGVDQERATGELARHVRVPGARFVGDDAGNATRRGCAAKPKPLSGSTASASNEWRTR